MWVDRGDDTDALYVKLPYAPWNVQWLQIRPDSVTALCEYDLIRNGWIDLSDLSRFGEGYGTLYDFHDFTMFGGVYRRRAWFEYGGER